MQIITKNFPGSLKEAFPFENVYSIENIVLSRFELIVKLAMQKKEAFIKENILICGFGSVGYSTLMYLLDLGYKKIDILVKNFSNKQQKEVDKLNNEYKSNINLVCCVSKYFTYIETTGKSDVIKKIFKQIEYNSTIFLIGTPREESYLISPLDIHRKNLNIFGGHELNGISWKQRKKMFIELLETNKNKELEAVVNIYENTPNKVNEILIKKSNFFEVIKYGL